MNTAIERLKHVDKCQSHRRRRRHISLRHNAQLPAWGAQTAFGVTFPLPHVRLQSAKVPHPTPRATRDRVPGFLTEAQKRFPPPCRGGPSSSSFPQWKRGCCQLRPRSLGALCFPPFSPASPVSQAGNEPSLKRSPREPLPHPLKSPQSAIRNQHSPLTALRYPAFLRSQRQKVHSPLKQRSKRIVLFFLFFFPFLFLGGLGRGGRDVVCLYRSL